MVCRNVFVFVNPKHDRDVFVLGGGGNDHFFNAATKVFLSVFGPGENSRRLDHDFGAY